MRTTSVAVIAILALGSIGLASDTPAGEPAKTQEPETIWGGGTSGWRLGVAVCQSAFRMGEPIMVRITTQNLSDTRRFAADYAFTAEGWTIEVTNLKDGEAMPYTREGQRMYGLDRARPRRDSVSRRRLEPGEGGYDTLWVNRVRDMTLAGKYSVRVSRQLVTETGEWVTVQAPSLELQVRGAQYPPSALPQVLALSPGRADKSRAMAALGSYLSSLVADLARAAEEDKLSDAGSTAWGQLLKLRDQLEAITKERPAPPGRTAPVKAQPEDKATRTEPSAGQPARAAGGTA